MGGLIMKLYIKRSKLKNSLLMGIVMSVLILGIGCSTKGEGSTDKETNTSKKEVSTELEKTELKYQGWTSQVIFPELAQELGYFGPLKLKWVGNTISGPQDVQTVATGNIDFGGAFTGAIINLKASNAPIKSVIGYYGVDKETYYSLTVLNESTIKTAKDLIGKKIGVNTLAAHHEFIIKEYLRRSGLTEDEIKKVELVVIPPANAEQVLRQKQIDAVILSGMFKDKATERGGVRSIFKDYDIFGAFTGGSYVMTENFINENPNTVKKFVEGNAKAIEWARNTPRSEVIAKMEKIIKERGRNEDATAVKYWKSTGVSGKGGLNTDKEIQMWIDWLVNEGKLKKDQIKPSDIYTNEFNPYK